MALIPPLENRKLGSRLTTSSSISAENEVFLFAKEPGWRTQSFFPAQARKAAIHSSRISIVMGVVKRRVRGKVPDLVRRERLHHDFPG
jgi:hypothetical protein